MELSTKSTEPLEACLQTAKQAGSPREQAENFVSVGYYPYPWQWTFHSVARDADRENGPVEIGLGGARGPGKSHAIFSQIALDDSKRVDGLKSLFIRKTAQSAKESFDDLIDKTIRGKVRFERANNVLRFENGSRILLGGFHNEDDIDKYIGIEYDLIAVEELNQLTEEKYIKLLGSLRTSKENWRPRTYTSFNPGGIGHNFVKERFVLPHRLMEEKRTRFVPSTYKSNPLLNAEYIQYLEGLGGDLGRAWREGDFDLFAGQYFREWRYETHVCQPFDIPKDWRRFCALDYGFNHPLSLGWYAIDPDGVLYRYRELVQSGLNYSEAAELFVSMTTPVEDIAYIVADPAIWAKKGERTDSLSGAEVFQGRVKELLKKDIRLVRADNNRILGWNSVREYLRPFEREGVLTAKFQVFSTCSALISCLPSQQHDERNPEDMLKQDGDDPADELRYAIMSRPTPSLTREQVGDIEFARMIKKKNSTVGKLHFYGNRGIR